MLELYHFKLLKDAVLSKFCEANPHWQRPLSEFGVREIAQLQALLQAEVGGRISEKWFYTHLKKDQGKLPRIDVLDLLSRYTGFEDWAGFQRAAGPLPPDAASTPEATGRSWVKLAATALGAVLGLFLLYSLLLGAVPGSERSLEACFADALTHQGITEGPIEIKLLQPGESPLTTQLGSDSCHTFRSRDGKLSFVVKAPYYLPDTIARSLKDRFQKETFYLRKDDYALLIHLVSTGKIADWKTRRQQLEQIIAPDAMIFQVDAESDVGVELYNKEEFIAKLTLPVSSLKNLRMLETEYDGTGRIKTLRFVQEGY